MMSLLLSLFFLQEINNVLSSQNAYHFFSIPSMGPILEAFAFVEDFEQKVTKEAKGLGWFEGRK